jgi:imidazole glycerol phosphate synthase glutamine amidotransferase subunit
MTADVSIIDYNMGNLYSISNAVKVLGYEPEVIDTPEQIAAANMIILPGVGAYRDAMAALHERGLVAALGNHVAAGKRLMGVCLGMQLLFQHSEENGGVDGLGILAGQVKRFPKADGFKVPQIQWNRAHAAAGSRMFAGLAADPYFYFLHSYYIEPAETNATITRSSYCDIEYCSAIEVHNVWGAQFHPEKSGEIGLLMLKNFLDQGKVDGNR